MLNMHQPREAWFGAVIERLRPAFQEAGSPLPIRVRATCGWPSRGALRASAKSSRVIGQAWPTIASSDGTAEIFISPCLSDTETVVATLVHELVHTALPMGSGHGPAFRKLATTMGLAGKMTATHAGPELTRTIQAMGLLPYPHASLDMSLSGRKKQTTRMIKVECPDCGCTVRMTAKWIENPGPPVCACGAQMEAEEKAE